jgi:hypothetical protein
LTLELQNAISPIGGLPRGIRGTFMPKEQEGQLGKQGEIPRYRSTSEQIRQAIQQEHPEWSSTRVLFEQIKQQKPSLDYTARRNEVLLTIYGVGVDMHDQLDDIAAEQRERGISSLSEEQEKLLPLMSKVERYVRGLYPDATDAELAISLGAVMYAPGIMQLVQKLDSMDETFNSNNPDTKPWFER